MTQRAIDFLNRRMNEVGGGWQQVGLKVDGLPRRLRIASLLDAAHYASIAEAFAEQPKLLANFCDQIELRKQGHVTLMWESPVDIPVRLRNFMFDKESDITTIPPEVIANDQDIDIG